MASNTVVDEAREMVKQFQEIAFSAEPIREIARRQFDATMRLGELATALLEALDEARAQAIEEAAMVAERFSDQSAALGFETLACIQSRNIATAIRRLSQQPENERAEG